MTPTEKLSLIRTKLDTVEYEIKYLEDLLTVTSGPQHETIAELNMLKEVEAFYRKQFSDAFKEQQDDAT